MNSELRQDIVSGDWIVISPKRAKKHLQNLGQEKRIKAPIKDCPFENPQKNGNGEPILIYPPAADSQRSKWEVMVVQNKYPVLSHLPALVRKAKQAGKNVCAKKIKKGPYLTIEGIGYHDLVISRNHYKNFAHLDKKTANLVFHAFRDRYLMLIKDRCLAYISIFHNWGSKAGATIYHPHYQMMALPVVPPDVEHSLSGSINYFKKFKKCVHCEMIEYERKEKKRIIYENQGAVVFTPFVSREPFELRVFPKKHLPYFEDIPDEDLKWVVEALQQALIKIEKRLKDPDYNFFIHTAPILEKNKYKNYHWHIEIQPKISISAGFELGTGIEITVVDPDEAAKILKA